MNRILADPQLGIAAGPVRSASPDEAERVIATLTLAFSGDPFVRFWFDEPLQYLASFPAGARAFGGNGFQHGSALCTEGYAGAALWLPPGVEPDHEALLAVFQRSVAQDKQADLFAISEQMDAGHPPEPHWCLPLIGVDPASQGRGLGSALLEHTLRQCDAERTVAYLESTNPRNIPLYQRHGFEVVRTIAVGAAPPLYRMARAPAARAPAPVRHP